MKLKGVKTSLYRERRIGVYPGQYYDSETGLHYNYFRYYNPQTGRYITPDPIGLEGGVNLFAYVQGNPIIKIDPLGLQESEFRPHPGYSDPPVSDDAPWGSAFPDPDSMAEGWRIGRESGYYKCLRNCLTKGSLPPVITTLIKEAIIKGAEHTAPFLAGIIYYMKYPKWFKAFGKYSDVYVPRLAGRIQSVAKGVSVAGWLIFYGEIYHCAQKCSNECL